MTSRKLSDKPVGVIGSGNFGTAIANILAENCNVLIHVRDEKSFKAIGETREHRKQTIHPNVTPTFSMEEIGSKCDVIFPIVPSAYFRSMMRDLSPHLKPYHILIHGTKGFDLKLKPGQTIDTME